MKRIFVIFLAASVLLVACSSETPIPESPKVNNQPAVQEVAQDTAPEVIQETSQETTQEVAQQVVAQTPKQTHTTIVVQPEQVKSKEEQPLPKSNCVVVSIENGSQTILEATSVEIADGDTVYDVLKNLTKENNIQMEASGVAAGTYVEGIANIYEFDQGPESGWMYSVNGVFQGQSAGAYKLNVGDIIEWEYTKNLGKDLKGESQ